MQQEVVKFVIVGCGHIGRRHAEKISLNPHAQVVALVDPLGREATVGTLYADCPMYASIEEMLQCGIDFDIASVCVPNGLHFEIAHTLLTAGKHTLIEKPIVLHPEEGEVLQQLADSRGVRIFSVLQNRYSPVSIWLKEVLEKGLLGKIYTIDMECFWNRDDRYYHPGGWHGHRNLDGGTLFTQYSHFLDLLLWFFGPAEVEATTFANYNHSHSIDFEDSGTVRLRFTQGSALGSIRYSTAVYGANCGVRLSILAEKGCVVLNGPFMNRIEHCLIENYTLPQVMDSAPGNDYGAYSGSAQNHHLVINNVVSALRGEPAEVVSCTEALHVVRLIRDIYRTNPYLLPCESNR